MQGRRMDGSERECDVANQSAILRPYFRYLVVN